MKPRIAHEIKASHNRVAEVYGILPVNGQTHRGYNQWNIDRNVRQKINKIIELHGIPDSLLDAGCGNGQIAQLYYDNGVKKIIGIDFARNMLMSARKRLADEFNHNKFACLQGDLEELNMLKDEKFSFCNLFGVIEHLDHPDVVLCQLYKKLKNNGILIVGIPRKWSLCFFSYLLFGQSPKDWGRKNSWIDRFRYTSKLQYYRFFTPHQVKSMIDKLPNAQIANRIAFGHFHLDGFPGLIWHFIASKFQNGYEILDCVSAISASIGLIPAGELWVIKKKKE